MIAFRHMSAYNQRMAETPATDSKSTRDWRRAAIRAVGVLFMLGGLWGVVGGLAHVPHFSVLATYFGITFDLGGVLFVAVGGNLFALKEAGRTWALWLICANLGILLVLSAVLLPRGQALDQLTLLEYRPQDLPLSVLLLVARGLLEAGLIVFLALRGTRAVFEQKARRRPV